MLAPQHRRSLASRNRLLDLGTVAQIEISARALAHAIEFFEVHQVRLSLGGRNVEAGGFAEYRLDYRRLAGGVHSRIVVMS